MTNKFIRWSNSECCIVKHSGNITT